MPIKVLVEIQDKYQSLEGKLIGEKQAIFFEGKTLLFSLVKPTDLENVYIQQSASEILSEDVKVSDKEKLFDEVEKALKTVTLFNYLSNLDQEGQIEEYNFRLIKDSKVKEFK